MEDLNYVYSEIFKNKDDVHTHGSHTLFRNTGGSKYRQKQVTFPRDGKVRAFPTVRIYVHQVVLLKKLNVLSLEPGLETSHLCHVKNCIKEDHIVAEPHHINNNRIHCLRERTDIGDKNYCRGHDPYARCLPQD